MSEFRIVYQNAEGGVSVVIPAPGVDIKEAARAVPDGREWHVINAEDQPDRTFRKAWQLSGDTITECPVKSRECAHELRRAARAVEFAPHDEVVAKRLPGEAEAEAARQAIRAKYDGVQSAIDAASDVAEMKRIVSAL